MILRMEDLDHPKVKPGTAEAAYADLRWMGLDWDEGPDVGGPHAVYVQTQRREHFAQAFDQLRAAGRIYPCVCSRQDIINAQSAPHDGEELHYPGTCRDRAADADTEAASARQPAWRFRVSDDAISTFDDIFCGPQQSRLADWSGDFVIARGRHEPAYQLAVVVDDAAMGITEVVRADDLLATTHRQLALYDALGLTPPAFCHVPLVVGPDGRRLAKRRHSRVHRARRRHTAGPTDRVAGVDAGPGRPRRRVVRARVAGALGFFARAA